MSTPTTSTPTTQRSVTHTTFTIERTYPASPSRVYAAWAEPATKARWFVGPEEWGPEEFELDFRVGGRELSRGGPRGGPVHTYIATYQEIVPAAHIIYAYEMLLDDTRISISLATVEFIGEGNATRLIFTEQGAYLDGSDNPADRERGTRELLDALAGIL